MVGSVRNLTVKFDYFNPRNAIPNSVRKLELDKMDNFYFDEIVAHSPSPRSVTVGGLAFKP